MKRRLMDMLATLAVTCALLASCDKPTVDIRDHSVVTVPMVADELP